MLGVAPPSGGDDYLFEKGTLLLGQRRGYSDVFKRGCFAWENKVHTHFNGTPSERHTVTRPTRRSCAGCWR